MGKNKKSNNTRKKTSYIQIVYSEPKYILKERYVTDYMLEKAIRNGMSKAEALDKYGKNRYMINPNAIPLKEIKHVL
jgi:hypothetical protein